MDIMIWKQFLKRNSTFESSHLWRLIIVWILWLCKYSLSLNDWIQQGQGNCTKMILSQGSDIIITFTSHRVKWKNFSWFWTKVIRAISHFKNSSRKLDIQSIMKSDHFSWCRNLSFWISWWLSMTDILTHRRIF